MWSISNLINNTSPIEAIAFSDGQPIDAVRGGAGNSFRLVINAFGFLDITDTGHQPGGPHYWQLVMNGNIYWYDGQGAITLAINNDGSFTVAGDGNYFSGSLTPLPIVSDSDINAFNWLVEEKFVPYQDIPDEPGKTTAEIIALGLQYFPYSSNSFQLAMSIYDWTTADFARIQFMRIFVYTAVSGLPMDSNSVANGIWTSNWGTYNPQNADYMNEFMMQPAATLADVVSQLNEVEPALRGTADAETNIICAALQSMPRVSVLAVPTLYSGQVDISNLGTEHFATYFLEFPLNNDPSVPLQMPLADALATFITVGQTLTLKGFMSFTNSQEDALHYSNGILVIVNPPAGAVNWTNTTFITPLSDGPEKIEYLFQPDTSFQITEITTVTINDKVITEIYLQLL